VTEELYEGLLKLCELNRRSLSVELSHAIARHLARPPLVVTPELEDATTADGPARRSRGRPRKEEE
jgi:hypothetical protein